MTTIKTGRLFRHLQLDRSAIDEASRTVALSFSSEEPYDRYFGTEILDHSPSSVRLGRLASGSAPFLMNHDTDEQIGVVDSVEISADRTGRALVRFSRSAEAQEYFQDVIDGIRGNISVGYIVHKMVMQESTDNGEVYRVTDWEPLEISLVAVPADPSVGVGRSLENDQIDTIIERPAAQEVIPETRSQEPPNTPQIIIERNYIMEQNQMQQGRDAEQKRAADLLAIADVYHQFGAREMVAEFIRNAKTPEQFKDALMEKITAKHSDASQAEIGMSNNERRNYSLIRAVQAAISGDWSKAGLERSASLAVAQRMGVSPEGFFVPVDSFTRAFTVGTAAEAGNLVQTSVLGNEFVDVLRNKLILAKLGIRMLGGLTSNIAIPKKASAATIGSYTENGAATPSTVNTGQIALSPKRVSGQVTYTKQALIQSSLDVDAMLRDDLTQTTAVQIENLIINGTAAGNQPRGILNQSGIGAVIGGVNGLQINWGHVVDLESACANANSEPDLLSGYAVNTKSRGWLKKVQKGTNLPMIWETGDMQLNGYRAAVSNNLSSTLNKGTSSGNCSSLIFGSDWSDLVFAMFGGFDVVTDPYTKAGTGEVVITCNQFIDVALRQPASFAAMSDALTA